MFGQRWRAEERSVDFSLIQHTWLSQQDIDMTHLIPNCSKVLRESLGSNLAPITPTQTVLAAVGNIVRRISADDTLLESVPASEELENAISSGIRENRIPVEQAGVWALIGRPMHNVVAATESKVATSEDTLSKEILKGCRLHRVLSGGGGWGEKQGLLALDPDSEYSINVGHSENLSESENDFRPDSVEGLGDVVKPGDTIRFYLYRSDSSQPTKYNVQDDRSIDDPHQVSMVFGTLPSTMDAMPNNSSAKTTDPSCKFAEGHFGMLSEWGMSLKVCTSASTLVMIS